MRAGTALLQVPLTYRDEPLEGAEDAFITQMEHSVLGDRWVYDGLRDPRFVLMLAAVALTGQGEALGMVQVDSRWIIVPSGVRIHGGGWTQEPSASGRYSSSCPMRRAPPFFATSNSSSPSSDARNRDRARPSV